MKKYKVFLILVSFLIISVVFAGKTKFYEVKIVDEFYRGTGVHVTLDKQGNMGLSPEIKEIFSQKDLLVYTMLKNKDFLFVGTGNPDILYQINQKTGEIKEIFKGKGLAVTSLTQIKDTLYFSESPSNTVYQYNIQTQELKELTIFTNETYVWKILAHKDKIYVATGDNAKIYELDLKGNKKELFSNLSENHFLALAAYEDSLYFGGEGKGGVYEYSFKTNKTQTLYSTYEGEVSHIALSTLGDLYFVTSAQTPKTPGSDFDYTDSLMIQNEASKKKAATNNNPEKPQAKPMVIKNSLYQIKNKKVDKLFTRDNTVFYQVLPLDNGDIYVGGAGGLIYRYQTKESQLSISTSLKEDQILILLKDENNFLVGTGNLGKVFSISYTFAPLGTFESRVFDLGGQGKLGNLSWFGTFPAKTGVRFFIRTGNSNEIDDSWSKWFGPYTNPNGSVVASQGERYLQYKIELFTSDYYSTPFIYALSQPFLSYNRKPEISFFKVNPANSKNNQPYLYNIKWQMNDSDEDVLISQLFFKATNDNIWLPLSDKMNADNFNLDSRILPDGEYQLKLVVSDELTNSAEEAESAEEISQPFFVDNTGPCVKVLNTQEVGEYIRIEGVFEDSTSFISKAFYSINAEKWIYFLPKDGIFDSSKEFFEIAFLKKELAKNEKENIIFIRVFDSQENQSTFKMKIDGRGKLINAEKSNF